MTDNSWHYSLGESMYGPISLDDLRKLRISNVLNDETLVWTNGQIDWLPLKQVLPLLLSPESSLNEVQLVGVTVKNSEEKDRLLQQLREGVDIPSDIDREHLLSLGITDERLSLGQLFTLATRIALGNYGAFFCTLLIYQLPFDIIFRLIPADILLINFSTKQAATILGILQSIPSTLTGLIVTAIFSHQVESSILGREISFKESTSLAFQRWLSSLATLVLSTCFCTIAALFFIVPGIIWTFYYSFAIFIVALRNISGNKALSYSKSLVIGQWWRTFWILFVAGIASTLIRLIIDQAITSLPTHPAINIFGDVIIYATEPIFTIVPIVLFLNYDYLRNRSPINREKS